MDQLLLNSYNFHLFTLHDANHSFAVLVDIAVGRWIVQIFQCACCLLVVGIGRNAQYLCHFLANVLGQFVDSYGTFTVVSDVETARKYFACTRMYGLFRRNTLYVMRFQKESICKPKGLHLKYHDIRIVLRVIFFALYMVLFCKVIDFFIIMSPNIKYFLNKFFG